MAGGACKVTAGGSKAGHVFVQRSSNFSLEAFCQCGFILILSSTQTNSVFMISSLLCPWFEVMIDLDEFKLYAVLSFLPESQQLYETSWEVTKV